jgi:plastocyanin
MTSNAWRHVLRSLPILVLAATVAAGTTACGGDDKKSDTGASGTEITIRDFSYSPNPLRANVGDTITVTNDDDTAHTLTADDNSVTTGDLSNGQSGTITLEKAGTLAYHCEIHGTSMKGSIQVSA